MFLSSYLLSSLNPSHNMHHHRPHSSADLSLPLRFSQQSAAYSLSFSAQSILSSLFSLMSSLMVGAILVYLVISSLQQHLEGSSYAKCRLIPVYISDKYCSMLTCESEIQEGRPSAMRTYLADGSISLRKDSKWWTFLNFSVRNSFTACLFISFQGEPLMSLRQLSLTYFCRDILPARSELASDSYSISLLSLLMYWQRKRFCSSCLRKVVVISQRSAMPLSSLISSKLFQMDCMVFLQASMTLIFSLFLLMRFFRRSFTRGWVSIVQVFSSASLFFFWKLLLFDSPKLPWMALTSSRNDFISLSFSRRILMIYDFAASMLSFFSRICSFFSLMRVWMPASLSVRVLKAQFWFFFSFLSSSISFLRRLLLARAQLQEAIDCSSYRYRIFTSPFFLIMSVLNCLLLRDSSSFILWLYSLSTSFLFSCTLKNLRLSCSRMRVQLSISLSITWLLDQDSAEVLRTDLFTDDSSSFLLPLYILPILIRIQCRFHRLT